MTVRVFCHQSLVEVFSQQGLDLDAFKEDFRRYKESGVPPSTFGRDAKYNHPNTMPTVRQEQVFHIHLEESDKPWVVHTVQFNKTSDVHLVYCRGFFDENCYALMALLSPNAHDQALDRDIMYNIGLMAEKFRNKY